MGQDELSHSVAALSRMLLKEETLGSALVRIARLAAELLPQADAATITISEAGGPTRTASSSDPGAQPASPRLVLDAEASVGQIRVIRGVAPAPVAPAVTSTAG